MEKNESIESSAQMVENSLVTAESLDLTNINNDCKEIIFEYLEWLDLLSLADTNKQLYTAVCHVFKRKYGNTKMCIGLPQYR